MSVQVSISMPDWVLTKGKASPREYAKEIRLAAAVKWYEAGMVSQAKAAELADLDRPGFLKALGRYKVSPFQYDAADLRREMNR